MEQDRPTFNLRDFLTILFKHKHKIWIVFMVTAISVTIGTLRSPSIYEAKTSLVVKFGRANIYRPEVGNSKKIFSSDPDKIMITEIQILTSRDLMEKTIDTLGVENIYPDLAKTSRKGLPPSESAIKRFKNNYSVGIVRDSDVINISFQHQDPNIAAKVANLLVELFKEKHIKVFGAPKTTFFKKQLKTYEKKWIKSENNLKAFKQKHQIFSYDEQRTLLLKQRTQMDSSLMSTQNRNKELEEKISSLELQMQSIPEKEPIYSGTANRSHIIDDATSNLLALKRKEQELFGKYKNFDAGNQLLTSVREEIKLVENFLEKQKEELKEKGIVRAGRNVTYQKIEMELIKAKADLSSLGAKSKNMKLQINQLDNDLVALDLTKQEYSRLSNKLATNEKNYETFLRKSEEANMAKEMDRLKMNNISVIQEAKVPANPIKPNRRLNVIMGFFLGAFSGIGLAFLSEYMGQGLSTPESVERRLGLPIIATVSYKG